MWYLRFHYHLCFFSLLMELGLLREAPWTQSGYAWLFKRGLVSVLIIVRDGAHDAYLESPSSCMFTGKRLARKAWRYQRVSQKADCHKSLINLSYNVVWNTPRLSGIWDTKGVIRSRNSKDRQYNGQKKKMTNRQTMICKTQYRKLRIEQREPY
jgi:hypothetical protein